MFLSPDRAIFLYGLEYFDGGHSANPIFAVPFSFGFCGFFGLFVDGGGGGISVEAGF